MDTHTLEEVIADALGIAAASVTDELGYGTIPEWDSLRHVELMLALEEHWGVRIDADLVLDLTTVEAIRAFAQRRTEGVTRLTPDAPEGPTVHRGLTGVYVDDTRISHINGAAGQLAYRGYPIEDLVEHATFEETAFLLLFDDLPTGQELEAFRKELKASRAIPPPVREVLRQVKDARPIDALRTGVSALSAFDPDRGDRSVDGARRAGIRLIAQVPSVLAVHRAAATGRAPEARLDEPSHAGFILSALTDEVPSEKAVRSLEQGLILLAEHGSNASAFAARVAIGAGSDLHGAVTAAIAAFAGAIHGGAIEGVTEMVRTIGEPAGAAEHVRALRARKEPVLGLGHRLYRTEDPRARFLRGLARALSSDAGDQNPFLILEEVRTAMHPHTRFGVDVNVDFYAGLVFSLLGIRTELLTPTFAAARLVGWAAHALEQRRHNVLIRPLLRYIGEDARDYTPLATRDTPQLGRGRPASGSD
jgi:citrate synthase